MGGMNDAEKVDLLNEGHPQLPLSPDLNDFWQMARDGGTHLALMSVGMRDDKCDCCGKNTYEGFWAAGMYSYQRLFAAPVKQTRAPRIMTFHDEFFEHHDALKSFRTGAPYIFALCEECHWLISADPSQEDTNGTEVDTFLHLFNTRRKNYERHD